MEHLKRFVQDLTSAGYQLDRSAYDYLKAMDELQASDFERTLLLTIGQGTNGGRILTRQELLELSKPSLTQPASVAVSVAQTVPAKEILPRCEVIRDPSKEIGTGNDSRLLPLLQRQIPKAVQGTRGAI